jgi:hypothetical protein
MDESEWGFQRYVTLLVVAAFHAALLAVLLMASRVGNLVLPTSVPIEVMFISPATLPRIRSEHPRPRHLSGDTAISITPPVLDSAPSAQSPPTSGSDGNGSGVDWIAEARRAVRAYDIRSHQPPLNDSVSGSPAEDTWWPRAPHHAGEQFKTANGDWIVWINSSCYQIAASVSPSYVPGASPPQTICPGDSAKPHAKQ